MCRSTVSSNKVSPPYLFLFSSALALRWGTEPGEGTGLKGHLWSGTQPWPRRRSLWRGVGWQKRLVKPSALGPASAASELILWSYTTPARDRML